MRNFELEGLLFVWKKKEGVKERKVNDSRQEERKKERNASRVD